MRDDAPYPSDDDAPYQDGSPDVFVVIEEAWRRITATSTPSGGDASTLKRIELELLDPAFVHACASHPDQTAVIISVSQLRRHSFTEAAKKIEKAIVARRTVLVREAEATRQAEEAARRAAFRRAAAEAEASTDWPRERRGPHPLVEASLARAKGGPRATAGNVLKAIRDDPRWGPHVRVNRLGNQTEMWGKPIEDENCEVLHATEWLADTYDLHVSTTQTRDALFACASLHAYHPVRAYLEGLPEWDGSQTIYRVLPEILGIVLHPNADDETRARFNLYQTYMRRMLISAVARALRPGCKVDTALIFVGKQGAQKSTFFRTLFGSEFFGDSAIPIGDKNAAIQLASTWGYELAEMASLNKRTSEEVKQFLSQVDDLYRQIFERDARRKLRHSIMVGSVNKMEFLVDDTGERRFWPIEIPSGNVINLRQLRLLRDALWAEAVAAYRKAEVAIAADEDVPADCRWWFNQEEEDARAGEIARHAVTDLWDSIVSEWIQEQRRQTIGAFTFTTAQALIGATDTKKDRMGTPEERRMSAVLKRLGWRKKREQVSGAYRDVWTDAPVTARAPTVAREEPPDPTDDDYRVGADGNIY
jgi:predicted P-loop ATPase